MCLCFPRWRRHDDGINGLNGNGTPKPRRARTLPILRTNTENLPALREMINTTLLIPTKHPRLSNRTPTFRSLGGRVIPKIHITGADMARRASLHGFDALPELDDAFYVKLEHAFNDICRRKSILVAKEAFITRDQFVAWLENTQGEDPEDVDKFLPQDKDRYLKGEFLEMLLMRFGCDAETPVNLDDKDLDRPITNYFISSSHNTYIEGNQLASRSSPEAYKMVLERGCRCIEIDVWNGDVTTPEVPRNGGGSGSGSAKLARPEHSRNLSAASGASFSGTSLPNAAASVFETVGGMASILGDGGNASVHSRNPSEASKLAVTPRDSVPALDPRESSGDLIATRVTSNTRTPYPRDEPIVTHGWTLTKPCGFREVCVAIRESAFETNDLPIIISLEVHANHAQQDVMVRIMKQEWGDMLLDEPLDGIDQRFRVPTLADLRRKILIKVKKPPRRIEVPESTLALPHEDEDGASDSDEDNTHMIAARTATPNNNNSKALSTGAPPKAARIPVGPVLGALAIYTHSERFKRFEEASKKPSHIYSIAESRILELNTTHHREMFTHNKNYFMRLFPNGTRIDSSNPDPSLFWRKGVQMVSLNWQYIDEALMLNEGMFAGEQGWVLKPPGYLSSDRACVTQADVKAADTVMLTVSVLAGQNIWVPPDSDSSSSQSASSLRSVVKCELHVEKQPTAGNRANGSTGAEVVARGSEKYKLETSAKKTDRPVWGDRSDTLKFPLAKNVVESLSFVRFKIENESRIGADELLSWACIRLDRLRPGYRCVRLMDTKGHPIKDGKLLVRIHKVVR